MNTIHTLVVANSCLTGLKTSLTRGKSYLIILTYPKKNVQILLYWTSIVPNYIMFALIPTDKCSPYFPSRKLLSAIYGDHHRNSYPLKWIIVEPSHNRHIYKTTSASTVRKITIGHWKTVRRRRSRSLLWDFIS